MTKKIITLFSILALSACSININLNNSPSPTPVTPQEPTITQPQTYPSIEDQLTTFFLNKFNKSIDNITLTVSQNTGTHARGGIKFNDEIAGAMWLAHIDQGLWYVDHDGNGTIPCQNVEPFNYPNSILTECWDETTNSIKQL